uniref:Uncharacterized protein n=1 Tax=Quercus lobata TaxID=97700 RepID=A0A7N2L2N1_QUELO
MVSNATAGLTCPSPMKPTSNGIFQGDDPLQFSLPLAIMQICLVVVVTWGQAFIQKPLRQPRVIAEIIAKGFIGTFLQLQHLVGTALSGFGRYQLHQFLYPE